MKCSRILLFCSLTSVLMCLSEATVDKNLRTLLYVTHDKLINLNFKVGDFSKNSLDYKSTSDLHSLTSIINTQDGFNENDVNESDINSKVDDDDDEDYEYYDSIQNNLTSLTTSTTTTKRSTIYSSINKPSTLKNTYESNTESTFSVIMRATSPPPTPPSYPPPMSPQLCSSLENKFEKHFHCTSTASNIHIRIRSIFPVLFSFVYILSLALLDNLIY